MQCRSCSADIDAKAIVCYRCGAPTAAAPVPPGGRRRPRPGAVWLFVIVLAALAGVVFFVWYL